MLNQLIVDGDDGLLFDEFEQLCDLVIREDSEEELMFFWKSHLDASGHNSPLLVVAGYLATRPKWKHFNRLWREALTSNGYMDIFHATDFESREKAFTESKGWGDDRINLVRAKLVEAIIDSGLELAVTSAVVIKDYAQYMGGWRGEIFGRAYEFCARNCMSSATYYLQERRIKEPVAHILELGDEGQGNLMLAFNKAFNHSEENRQFYRLGRLAFDTKTGAIGLQAADMLAFYTWHRETGTPFGGPIDRLFNSTRMIRTYFDEVEFRKQHDRDKESYSVSLPEAKATWNPPPVIEIEVQADFSEADRVLDELERLMETSPDLVYSLVKNPASVAKLFGFETENEITPGANNLRVFLKPNDLAFERIAAIRTSHGQPDLGK